MVAILFVASAAAARAATGILNPPLSPRNASYSIDARLDPGTKTITASEQIVWRNITSRSAGELQFHLYWNAWKDGRSTYMREAALQGGGRPEPRANDWSSLGMTSIRLDQGGSPVDLTGRQRFIAPDDGNTDDRTVMAVSLPQPVAPGAAVRLAIEWRAHVPRTFSRTGAIGNYFFIAQWFPKLGVLEDEGWNCHQFHAATEFFSDYGVYDVRLTVPKGWTVGATGVERDRRDNPDGTTTHRYYQEDVHDFAWTTSPRYVERLATFEHPTLPRVEMRLLLQREHASQADRHFDATRDALRYYGEWYGAYPYGHITIVDPAYQSATGGMEYPTLFTAGTRWLSPRDSDTPERVTIHEAGHQFWYGIVGTNEFEHAWMDEGINTFSEARAMAQAARPSHLTQRYFGGFIPFVFRDIPLRRETDWNRWRGYRLNAKSDAQSTPSFKYFPETGYAITYNKTALWLNTMERWLGWPAVRQMLTTFFGRWQFRHPKPRDFFAVVDEVAGRDLGWYIDEVHGSSDVFDYGIQLLWSDETSDHRRFRTEVVVRRYGEATFPVDVRVTFTDGEQVTEHWDGRDRWNLYTYERPVRARSAVVDPDRVLLLDVNLTNNSSTLEPRGSEAATKWSAKWMVWLQDCLLSWGMFV